MTGRPVPRKDLQAKEICQEDRPASRIKVWIAGLLLLLVLPLTALGQTTETLKPRCSGTESSGPEMVIIPAGNFLMGSPEVGQNENEVPQHRVSVGRFALAVCEVTVAEFRRFIELSGYVSSAERSKAGCAHNSAPGQTDWEVRPEFSWRNALHGDSGDHHPVVCVSHADAVAYAEWLSALTGANYRLPTEAEWEYAARAGSTQRRYYGDRSQCGYANGADSHTGEVYTDLTSADCPDNFVHTAPVSHFAPNDWGLYDMLGNVWEWTQDCWHDDYTDAPVDGSAWMDADNGDCDRRVLRGGGWGGRPDDLRAALRFGGFRAGAGFDAGFRLARTR